MEKKRELVSLLEKITYAKNVYNQASTGMHSSVMKNEMRKMRASREDMAEDIALKTGIKAVRNGQPPLFEKFWVMLNDLLIQRNTPYILKSCVKADRMAIEEFEKLFETKDMDEGKLGVLRPHYEELVDQVNEFEKEIDQYPWS